MDSDIVRAFQKTLTKQGLKFVLGAAVQGTQIKNNKATVSYKLRKDDSEHTIQADTVLVATGRKPYTTGLGLDTLGVAMSDRGQIKTDDHYRTWPKASQASTRM